MVMAAIVMVVMTSTRNSVDSFFGGERVAATKWHEHLALWQNIWSGPAGDDGDDDGGGDDDDGGGGWGCWARCGKLWGFKPASPFQKKEHSPYEIKRLRVFLSFLSNPFHKNCLTSTLPSPAGLKGWKNGWTQQPKVTGVEKMYKHPQHRSWSLMGNCHLSSVVIGCSLFTWGHYNTSFNNTCFQQSLLWLGVFPFFIKHHFFTLYFRKKNHNM